MPGQNSKRKLRIAIDAMGGDFAPGEILNGALQAGNEFIVTSPAL